MRGAEAASEAWRAATKQPPASAPVTGQAAAAVAKYTRQKKAPASQAEPQADEPPTTFFALAPVAITEHGLADLVNQLVKAPGSWAEKATKLQAAMQNLTAS